MLSVLKLTLEKGCEGAWKHKWCFSSCWGWEAYGKSITAATASYHSPTAPHHANTHPCETHLWPTHKDSGIPDSHCTIFLSHTQDMDLACCFCENDVYFMYLPVCPLPTKLGRRLFEIVKFHSLIISSVSALVAAVFELRIPCKQFRILLSH